MDRTVHSGPCGHGAARQGQAANAALHPDHRRLRALVMGLTLRLVPFPCWCMAILLTCRLQYLYGAAGRGGQSALSPASITSMKPSVIKQSMSTMICMFGSHGRGAGALRWCMRCCCLPHRRCAYLAPRAVWCFWSPPSTCSCGGISAAAAAFALRPLQAD